MIENCTKKKKMKNKNYRKSKYLHLISYNYKKNILEKNVKFKNKKCKKDK